MADEQLVIDQQKIIAEVNKKFMDWREQRRPHELTWFTSKAFSSGQQNFNQHPLMSNKILPDVQDSSFRSKPTINRIFPKARARFAKFTKSRPQPFVIPFTTERRDKLNARATQRALDYFWEKAKLEVRYREVLLWARDAHKGFLWISWNPNKLAPVRTKNEIGEDVITDAQVGDIEVESGSPFEVLPSDIRIARTADQPEIMRIKARDVEEVKQRYQSFLSEEDLAKIKADAGTSDLFQYERQIATLNARAFGMTAPLAEDKENQTHVVVKELFTRPSVRYPNGRYVVVAGDVLLRYQEKLPYDFADMDNPYPAIEFVDLPTVGQFWGTTVVEQLVPIQRAYNKIRQKLDLHLHKMVHNKWFVPKQAQLPEGSLTNDVDEVVEYNYIPGMPEPHQSQSVPLSSDVWRAIQIYKEEIDDVSQVFPAAEGKVGKETSGFHANLLQEAVDEIMTPEARGHEMAIEDLALKIRRLMKQGYNTPRLISIAGRNRQPEVMEFHSGQIDEHAAIKVQVGSGLSGFKAARINQLVELYKEGLLGDPNDPEVKRRTLSMMDMGGTEEAQEQAARHEELARLENDEIFEGKEIPIPQFYENHLIHYGVHTDQLSSTETRDWSDEIRLNLIRHTLLHFKFINPGAAFQLANQYGFKDLIESGLIPPPPQEAQPPQEQAPQPAPQPPTAA